jgi:SHAQKYF class myb-like DNA-binding protein
LVGLLQSKSSQNSSGRWTKEEHQRFVDGIKLYGKNWKLVEDYVGTRNGAQIRSHAQKFFNRLEREFVKPEDSKPSAGKKLKDKSLRKFSECSVSTSDTAHGEKAHLPACGDNHTEEPNSEGTSLQNNNVEEVKKVTEIEVHSMPSNSPKPADFEALNQLRRTPRKMSADVVLTCTGPQSLFDLVMSKFQNFQFNPLKLSDLVELPTTTLLSNNTDLFSHSTTITFRPNPRKMSEDNVLIKQTANFFRKPDLMEYELVSKKLKSTEEDH